MSFEVDKNEILDAIIEALTAHYGSDPAVIKVWEDGASEIVFSQIGGQSFKIVVTEF